MGMGVVMEVMVVMVVPHHQQVARFPVVVVIYVIIVVHTVLVKVVLCLHVVHRICGNRPQTELTPSMLQTGYLAPKLQLLLF
jgi:hypothetical protein